jgi:hypothetical protein
MAAHDTVAHAWAHQTGKARKGYNMFYDGPSLFSHGRHWELARLVTLPDGRQAAMLYEPSRQRSVSTHTHYRCAQAATSHMPQFSVQSFDDHAANYQWWLTEAAQHVAKASRAKKWGAYSLTAASRCLGDANDYSEAWQLGHGFVGMADVPGWSPELAAKIEARRAAEETRQAERDRKEVYRRRITSKATLRAWLHGDPDCHYAPRTFFPLCRVKGDEVQTSWGASVPLADALRLFKVATACRAKGEGWTPCGLWTHKAGDFAVTRITPTGGLVIGCHSIPYRSAKLAADMAGIAI